MIKPDMIPDAVWIAMQRVIGDHVSVETQTEAIAAAINAWPGMHLGAPWVIGVPNATSIILPLQQKETSDEHD